MYSVMSYGHMAADGVRMDAYARALAQAVEPGAVVVDLGAGTGILSLLAAKAGARKVYAIDTNPAIHLLRELAEENGLSRCIEIHEGSSLDVKLPEKADVVVSDLRGSTSLNDEHLALIRDARKRLLRPGGALLPKEDRLMVALVTSDKLAQDLERSLVGFTEAGLSARAALTSIRNSVYSDRSSALAASDVLSTSARWATVDFATAEPAVFEGEVELRVARGGRANALAVWFDTTVLEGIDYTTAPGHSTVYARTLLPLSEPLNVSVDDGVRVHMSANWRGERWAWDTSLVDPRGAPKASFKQTTFFGVPTSPEALLRASSAFVPTKSPLGARAASILAAMDGVRTVAEIAEHVAIDSRLSRDRSLDEVRELVSRYAR